MNSIFHFQDAIKAALRENLSKKYFFFFNKWNTIELHDGRKFRIKIEQIIEECVQ